ncbi:VOC family protein [uncultured Friedmanniella sp.]|uniref:VOC family protein n=1 Tax=uncultured Friedmanniella sp. TaxID=335381 RepID=UPI0035C969F6
MSPTEPDPAEVPPGRLRFKDLCLDAVEPAVAARFWSAALGLEATDRGDLYVLTDDHAEHTLWVNRVPEPRTVKQRVHLDLHVRAVADLVALGATVAAELPHWTVLRDPEGGELCAFERPPDQLPPYRMYELGVDAADSAAIAGWWAELFGVEVHQDESGELCWLEGVPGMPFGLDFVTVPEPKQVKNRVHSDVWGRTADAVATGARLLRARDHQISWDVLADPEGNEFCVFPLAPENAPSTG